MIFAVCVSIGYIFIQSIILLRDEIIMQALQQILIDEQHMIRFGERFAKALWMEMGAIIFLKGCLGVGKTTLVRSILQAMGHDGKVKSPSYSLVEPYIIHGKQIFHFDLYRVHDPEELTYIGDREDYFFETATVFIEWPDKGYPFLPPTDLECTILLCSMENTDLNTSREISIQAHSERGQRLLGYLKQ